MSETDSYLTSPFADPEEPRATMAPPSGHSHCSNCGTRLRGRYCHACGQLDQPLRLPAHRYAIQAFTEFFGVDGRVWRTLRLLLFTPGALTNAYHKGERRRYLRPLRVYLTSTLLFFFLLSVLDPVGRLEGAITDGEALRDSTMTAGAFVAHLEAELLDDGADRQAWADSLQGRLGEVAAAAEADSLTDPLSDEGPGLRAQVDLDDLVGRAVTLERQRTVWQRDQAASFPPDSLIQPGDLIAASELVIGGDRADLEIGVGDEWFQRGRAYQRLKSARTSTEQVRAGVDLARAAIAKLPVVMFLMLPVFAMLLKVIYVRRGWFYSEHLIFGLHTHAFAFVVFTVVALLAALGGGAIPGGVLVTITLVGIPTYFLLAQKRVYGQGWPKTVAKALVLGATYSFVLLAFGLVLTALLTFVTG